MEIPTILHVGTTKTGSTSVQNLLDANRAALLGQGVLFPASVFTRKVAAQPERTSGHLQLIRDIAAGDVSAFEAERRSTPHDRLVLSAENIFHYPDEAPLHALRKLLGEAAITLVVVLRRQDHWLASYYAECVQGGWNREARSYDHFARDIAASGMLDYHAGVNRMVRIFRPETVRVIDYDTAKAGAGVVEEVLEAGLIPLDLAHVKMTPRSHVSHYDIEGLEAHRRLNALARVFWSKHMHIWTQAMLAETRTTDRGAPPTPSNQTCEDLMSALDLSNALLSATYLHGAPFTIPMSWRAGSFSDRDEARVRKLILAGLEHFVAVRDTAKSFIKRAHNIPPVLTLGQREIDWLLQAVQRARHVLGYQADAMAYLAALQPHCHAIFADADAEHAQYMQLDLDRLALPSTPLIQSCSAGTDPWTLPGVRQPDLILIPQSFAAKGLEQCRRNIQKNTSVVIYPETTPATLMADTVPSPDTHVGALAIYEIGPA